MPLPPVIVSRTPAQLIAQLRELPASGKILPTLQRLIERDDVLLDRVAELIQLEPGLAANVVRMSNSTLFGGKNVQTISEAIQRVGMNGVQELVASATASQLNGRDLKTYGLNSETLWKRAITCGLAASSLAERAGLETVDAYTAGLLHGIGLVALDQFATQNKHVGILESTGYPLDFALAERKWLGFSHAEAGAELLRKWGFADAVVAAVAYQLEPEKAGEHRKLAMIIATARWARTLFCVPEELIPELPATEWLHEAGIEVNQFGPWLDQLRERCSIAVEGLRLRR